MKEKVKHVTFLALIYLVFMAMVLSTGCKKEDEIPDTKEPTYIKNDSVNDNVCVIDSTIAILKSDSLKLSQGIYEFEFNGIPTNYKTGDIIVGTTGNGYLRKVINSTVNGNTVVLETEQGTLNELFKDATIDLDINFTDEKNNVKLSSNRIIKQVSYPIVRKSFVDGVSIGSDKVIRFNNFTLLEKNGVSFIITNGSVTFKPDIGLLARIGLTVPQNDRRIVFGLYDSEFNIVCDVQLKALAKKELEYEKVIGSLERKVEFLVGPVPVILFVKINLIAKLNLNFKSELDINSGFTYNSTFTTALDYFGYSNKFDFTKNLKHSLTAKPIEFNNVVEAEQILTITPRVNILIYDVVGPYFSAGLYSNLTEKATMPSKDWDATLGVGAKSNIGITLNNVFYEEGDIEWASKEFDLFSTTIWNAPDSLIPISPLEIKENANESTTVIVKVKDNLGNGIPFVNVYFEAQTGNVLIQAIKKLVGIRSDNQYNEMIAKTDLNGIATATWTFANAANQNLVVKVRKADGTQINGSPLFFTANIDDFPPLLPNSDSILPLLIFALLYYFWCYYKRVIRQNN